MKAFTSVIDPIRAFTGKFPSTFRLLGIVALTAIAIGITFQLSPVANTDVGAGAAVTIAVLGLTLLTGWSGQISLGNSGFMAVGGFATGIWAAHHQTSSPIIYSLLIATASGAVVGLILGLPAARLRGPYLAGMTIAFAVVLPEIIPNLSSWTGTTGSVGLNVTPPPQWFTNLMSGEYPLQNGIAQWPTDIAIIIAGVSFIFMANIFRSKIGRAMRLVRDNDVAAELVGVNLSRTRVLAFVISAAYGGLAGAVFVLLTNQITINTFPFPFSITLLTVMVIGGIGSLWGAVIAGVIYAFSASIINWVSNTIGVNPMSNLHNSMQEILFGAALILTMIFAPRGLVGLVAQVKRLGKLALSRTQVPPDIAVPESITEP
jgi:branched-chain amino acid transport system permease protein